MDWHKRVKVSKSSVKYREGSDSEHCGNCSMYDSGTCSLVKGTIRPDMVCDRWEKRG